MSVRRFASPFAALALILAIPTLTGANGSGCGGDVVVGNDECTVDADCEPYDLSCKVCADGSCAPTACVEGTCQQVCGDDPPGCQSDDECIPPPFCQACADGSCAYGVCNAGQCELTCGGGGECSAASDCPQVELCQVCPDGSRAEIDCVSGSCGFVCPIGTLSVASTGRIQNDCGPADGPAIGFKVGTQSVCGESADSAPQVWFLAHPAQLDEIAVGDKWVGDGGTTGGLMVSWFPQGNSAGVVENADGEIEVLSVGAADVEVKYMFILADGTQYSGVALLTVCDNPFPGCG